MLNRRRREEETAILRDTIQQAEQQIESGQDAFLVVAGEGYHLGIVGIVASRLAERFNRPAVVLRLDDGVARGSARSIAGFNVHDALGQCAQWLLEYGGHAAAAGLQVKPEHLDAFRTAVNDCAARTFDTEEPVPELQIDGELRDGELSWEFYRDVQRLEPFGEENPSPKFLLHRVTAAYPPRVVGSNHLRMSVRTGPNIFPAIGFNMGDYLPLCESTSLPFDLVCRPKESHYQGRTSLELELLDLRPAR
jgi:single-stranded-DNA-specific exonuclease